MFQKSADITFLWTLHSNNSVKINRIIIVLWQFFISIQCTIKLCKGSFTRSVFKNPIFVGSENRIVRTHWKWPSDTRIRNFEKNGWKQDKLYFHPTIFLKDERRRQILHDISVIVLGPNWRFFVGSEDRIVWTHYKWPSCILTTKTEPWNQERLNTCFRFSEPRIGSLKSDRVNRP